MRDSNHLLEQITQKIVHSSTISPIPAGLANTQPLLCEEHLKSINEVFALFRVNYHNQYYAAYKNSSLLSTTKKLWANSLCRFDSQVLIRAAEKIIQQEAYLPTLYTMIQSCIALSRNFSLPNTHDAYMEACTASSPKRNVVWNHPAVFYAGQRSNWFFLANNSEKIAYPIFKGHYEDLCHYIINGGTLRDISPVSLPNKPEKFLTKEQNIERIIKLRADLGI